MYTAYFFIQDYFLNKITWLKENRIQLQTDGFELCSAIDCLHYFHVVIKPTKQFL